MVGAYRIVGQFGQGGMATVYKAYHPQLERHVAIKFLQQSYVDDVNFLTRFEREAKIIASLDHPNIVPVYDFNYYNGQPYLVMKLIEGVTLKEVMTDSSVSKAEVLDMLTAVANGLTYAHERHVLHRDIKPSNILVDSSKRPYITDFGLARMTQAAQSTLSQDMLMGTPHYMSPEQAKGTDDLGPATDIYSLGVILYEFAVGRVPFSGNTPYAIVHDHIYTPLPSPQEVNPSVSPQVEAVLVRALAKSPSDRYPSAVAMLSAFKEAFESAPSKSMSKPLAAPNPAPTSDKPIPSYTVGVPAQTEPFTSKTNSSPKWLIPAGIAAFLLVVLIAAVAVMNRPSRKSAETPLPTLASLGQTTSINPTRSSVALASTVTPSAIADLSVDQAQATLTNNPNDEQAYLALAKALWLRDENEAAQKAVQDGYAVASDKISYLLSAASIANQVDRVTASLFLDGQALWAAQNDAARYPDVRAQVGEALYKAALSPSNVDIRELERLNRSVPDFQQPALFDIMAVQLLVTQKRLSLAQVAYNRLSSATTKLPEAYLVHGELLQAQGNNEKANKEWKAALQIPDTPQWVTERITELLKSN
jgi:serine/threonine protein kinase